jgi:hypothetical protein
MTEYDKIADLDNEVEARVLAGLLEDAGIPYALRSYHDVAFDGIFQLRKGWGTIDAPVENREDILNILHQMRDGSLGTDESE